MTTLVVGGILGGPLVTGGFSSGIFVEPEPVTADFLTALRSRLLETAALAELTEVYLTTSPPAADFPFLVISRLYQTPFINTSSSYYKEVGGQFTVLSQDAAEADVLGNAAYDTLFPSPGNPPLVFTDGYEMTRTPGQTRGPEAQAWGMIGGDPTWQFSFDYQFLIGKG